MTVELTQESPVRWRIEPHGRMRVPGVVFGSADLLPEVVADRSLEQVCNVATLPGIVTASFAMPDVHWGYGFPIGGVAATDVEAGGVVSPGGVGFDISCGVRLLVADRTAAELGEGLGAVMDALDRGIPRGLGPGGVWHLGGERDLRAVLTEGARAAVAAGYGTDADLARCEDRGALAGAEVAEVSERARARGLGQVGSLGSGNHFLEVQVVDEVVDERTAGAFGLRVGGICVMIHSGSRGLGHQVCSDFVKVMLARHPEIELPDRQLACAPVRSPEGEAYLAAMAAAANFGRANRQALTFATREAFRQVLGDVNLRLLYDVSHNLARLERHDLDGRERLLCVHRKGATRALPPGHPDLPDDLAPWGQPVLVPGSMGTASHVMVGVTGNPAFHACCHGAGRRMSRHAARKGVGGKQLAAELERAGVRVRAKSWKGLAEEAPFAYKDVDAVVAASEAAGLARRVARLRPIGVVKA
jgi:tRNA-splicing ligase RtcB